MEFSRIFSIVQKMPAKRAILLLGPPGAGKTTLGKALRTAIAQKLGLTTNDIAFELIDLNAHLPEDLAGYPKPNETSIHRLPEQWMRNLSVEVIGDKPGILILDDLSQTTKNMQAAVFRVALERSAGMTKLGPNVRVIITGNRRSDKAGASTLLSPLVSRCWTTTLLPDLESWLEWAASAGIDSRVQGFLRYKPKHLSQLPSDSDEEGRFASPRTWEFVSQSIEGEDDHTEIFDIATGYVGNPSVEFSAFCKHYHSLPDPMKALRDPKSIGRINEPDRLNAILTAIVDHAHNNQVESATLVTAIKVISAGRNEYAANALNHALSLYDMMDLAGSLKKIAPELSKALAKAFAGGR